MKGNGTQELAVGREDLNEIVAAVGDINVSLSVDIAVLAKGDNRMPRGGGGADDVELLLRRIKDGDAYSRRGQQIVLTVCGVPQCAKPRPNRGEYAAPGHKLVVYLSGGREHCRGEKTSCGAGQKRFSECLKHGGSDYRRAFAVACRFARARSGWLREKGRSQKASR